jgi:aminoglycoside phosphotransferase (APT) family kinase protein
MEASALRERLESHLRQIEGPNVSVGSADPLAGGACQEMYKVEIAGLAGAPERRLWVFRSDAKSSLDGSLDRAAELEVVRAAVLAGVKTPEPRWPSRDLLRPGAAAYFLPWCEGEAIGRRVVKARELEKARASLAGELARELAKIHGVRPAANPEMLDGRHAASPSFHPAKIMLDSMRARLERLAPSPSRELVVRWLVENLPPREGATLVHGDFRTGNFLVTPEGLSAILDWEFAHWGSPYYDLAWICVRDWRFGQLKLPVGGFARRDDFYAAYEAASGTKIDRKLAHYWEVLTNLRWAVGSVQQAQRYLSGLESDIELVAIGRRAAEMEFEALRLIETGVGASGGSPAWSKQGT